MMFHNTTFSPYTKNASSLVGKRLRGELGEHERIILKEHDVTVWTGPNRLRIGSDSEIL
jgi:hypothetical protein